MLLGLGLMQGVYAGSVARSGGGISSCQTFHIPAGSTNVTFTLTMTGGDYDLYVRAAGCPSTGTYDCRPYSGGTTTEVCNVGTVGACGGGFVPYYAFVDMYSWGGQGVTWTLTVTWTDPTCSGCNLASETNPLHSGAPAGCNNATFNVGSGAYYDLGISSDTWYNFTFTNGSSMSGFCATPLNGSGSAFSSNVTGWYSGTTTTLRVSSSRTSNTWGTTSGVMTYRRTSPTLGSPSTTAVNFCDASGNFGTAVTATGTANGNVVWDWGSNNGVWNVNWVGGAASGVCCFPKKVSNSDGNADRIRYRVTNGGCDAGPATTVAITNRYNEPPSSLTTSQNNYCATAVPANTTLTATFPSAINMNGTVRFYSGSCGGTLVGTVTPAANSSTAAVTITAPAVTTTYFVRYEPGAGTGCGNTACAQVTINVTPAPTVNVGPAMASICQGGTTSGLGGSVGGSATGGTWSTPAGGTFSPDANTLNATWTPPPGYTGVATLTLTTTGMAPCTSVSANKNVTVDANPGTANNATSNATICESSTKALTGTPAGGSWSVVSGGGSIAGTTYTPANVTSATSVTVRYSIAGNGACPGSTSDVTFTVDADPGTASNTTSNAAICENSTKALTGTPAGGSWSVVSGGGSIAGTTYTPANVTSATSVTVRYSIAGNGACPGSTSDVTFTVNADPGTAVNTTSNAAICESSTKALTGTPAGGTWSVISGGGSIAGTTYTPANVTSATSVTVRYTIAASGSCPGSTSDVTFTVDADPGTASNTTSNAAICESSTKALTGTPAGGTWSVVSGGGSIAGTTYTPANVTSATSVTVRYSIAASGTCPGSTSDVTFTVDADPGTASNTTSNAAICESSTKALTGTPAGGTWSVISGGGSIAGTTYTPANVTSATSVTVRYTIAASGSCPGSTSDVTFTVDANPGTASNTTSNAAICESSTKALTGTPAGGTWSVISGGGSIAGTIYTPANVTSATSVTVRYSIAASGTCPGSTSDVTFTVDADPGTASNTTSNAAICESSTKALTASPAGGSWSVVSGGGSIAGTTYTPANVTTATSVTVRYTVGASGSCPGSSSDVTFTVDADPGTASNTTSNAAICESATKALTGTPAGGSWSVVSGGGSIAGTTYTPANITSSTSVTVRYSLAASGACSGSASDVTFTVDPIPAAFTPVVVTSMPLCFRGNARVEFTGEAGVQYQLRDNTVNVNAPGNGPGTVPLHTDNLTANTTTYNVLASTGAGCTLNVAVPTITVSTTPTALANNNDSRTCYINGNNAYVEFFSANGSIMAINPGAQNLGDVTVTEYVGLPLGIQACGTSPTSEPQFNSATLGRHWTVSSTVAPTSNLNVRLYFGDVDVTALSLASLANVNPFDDVNTLADMELSKYSGANENGTFSDNCGNGTVTLHPQVGGGVMSAGNIGYTVGAAGYSVHTVSSFSEFWLSGTNNVSPLPIELTSFTATCVNGMVSLHWITASEINNEQFLVERSDNLQAWEQVALLPGAGNSNQTLHYQTVDERPLQGLSYYRLTQRDFDGKSETFAPVSVTCYSDGEGNTLMLYPNPATQEFKVAVTAAQDAPGTLRVTELNGKTVYLQNLNLVKGQNEFRVDVAALNPGTYVVHLISENMDLKPVKVIVIK